MFTGQVSSRVSKVFRVSFENHPLRYDDPGVALESAREVALQEVPPGVTGEFDDQTLTFTCDDSSEKKE